MLIYNTYLLNMFILLYIKIQLIKNKFYKKKKLNFNFYFFKNFKFFFIFILYIINEKIIFLNTEILKNKFTCYIKLNLFSIFNIV